jgi:hypothetical protein
MVVVVVVVVVVAWGHQVAWQHGFYRFNSATACKVSVPRLLAFEPSFPTFRAVPLAIYVLSYPIF